MMQRPTFHPLKQLSVNAVVLWSSASFRTSIPDHLSRVLVIASSLSFFGPAKSIANVSPDHCGRDALPRKNPPYARYCTSNNMDQTTLRGKIDA